MVIHYASTLPRRYVHSEKDCWSTTGVIDPLKHTTPLAVFGFLQACYHFVFPYKCAATDSVGFASKGASTDQFGVPRGVHADECAAPAPSEEETMLVDERALKSIVQCLVARHIGGNAYVREDVIPVLALAVEEMLTSTLTRMSRVRRHDNDMAVRWWASSPGYLYG